MTQVAVVNVVPPIHWVFRHAAHELAKRVPGSIEGARAVRDGAVWIESVHPTFTGSFRSLSGNGRPKCVSARYACEDDT
eukprot:5611843-Amphidinium_carterae.1